MPIGNIISGLFPGPTSTNSSSNPLWDLQAQYFPGTFQAATELYNQGAAAPYQGQRVAGFDPVRAQGVNVGVDAALGPQQQLASGQANLLTGILGGTDAGTQTLAQQASAAAQSPYGGAGTLGSARSNQAGANAAAQAILDRQLQASGQVSSALQNQLAPAQTLTQAGKSFQDYQQNLIDADRDLYQETADQPYQHLQRYQGLLAPQGVTAPTSSTERTGSDIGGVLGSLFSLAKGGEVPGYANGGSIDPQTTEIAQNVYSPVDVVPTSGPQSNYGWAIVDGRYQLVPANRPDRNVGTPPGAGTYTPTPIGFNPNTGQTALQQPGRTSETGRAGREFVQSQAPGRGTVLPDAEFNRLSGIVGDAIGRSDYNPRTDVLTPEEQAIIRNWETTLDGDSNTNDYARDPRIAQEDLAFSLTGVTPLGIRDSAEIAFLNREPSFANPSRGESALLSGTDRPAPIGGSYGGSLVTGQLSGNPSGVPGFFGGPADSVYSAINPAGAIAAQGRDFAGRAGSTGTEGNYDISSWFDASSVPAADSRFSGVAGPDADITSPFKAILPVAPEHQAAAQRAAPSASQSIVNAHIAASRGGSSGESAESQASRERGLRQSLANTQADAAARGVTLQAPRDLVDVARESSRSSSSSSSSSGGGGGGTHCCTAAYSQGMPIKKIKELRKWHRQQSPLWQEGYDVYGKFIADNLVSGSKFWSKVTEAGHTAFVEKKLTPMSALAFLTIAPGSLITGVVLKLKSKKEKVNATC